MESLAAGGGERGGGGGGGGGPVQVVVVFPGAGDRAAAAAAGDGDEELAVAVAAAHRAEAPRGLVVAHHRGLGLRARWPARVVATDRRGMGCVPGAAGRGEETLLFFSS